MNVALVCWIGWTTYLTLFTLFLNADICPMCAILCFLFCCVCACNKVAYFSALTPLTIVVFCLFVLSPFLHCLLMLVWIECGVKVMWLGAKKNAYVHDISRRIKSS